MKFEGFIRLAVAIYLSGCVNDVTDPLIAAEHDTQSKRSSLDQGDQEARYQSSTPLRPVSWLRTPVRVGEIVESGDSGSKEVITLERVEWDAAYFRMGLPSLVATGTVYRIERNSNLGEQIPNMNSQFLIKIEPDHVWLEKAEPYPPPARVESKFVQIGEKVQLGSNTVVTLESIDESGAYFRGSGDATGKVCQIQRHANVRDRISGAQSWFLTGIYGDKILLSGRRYLKPLFPTDYGISISHGFSNRRVRVGENIQLGPRVVVTLDRIEGNAAFFRRSVPDVPTGIIHRIERGQNVRSQIVDAEAEFLSEIGPDSITLQKLDIRYEKVWPDGRSEPLRTDDDER